MEERIKFKNVSTALVQAVCLPRRKTQQLNEALLLDVYLRCLSNFLLQTKEAMSKTCCCCCCCYCRCNARGLGQKFAAALPLHRLRLRRAPLRRATPRATRAGVRHHEVLPAM